MLAIGTFDEISYEPLVNNFQIIVIFRFREDPFLNSIDADLKEPITEDLIESVNELKTRVKPELLQYVLYDVITAQLCKYQPTENENWPEMKLRDMIYGHLEERGQDDLALEITQHFDEKLLTKHATMLFRNLVAKFWTKRIVISYVLWIYQLPSLIKVIFPHFQKESTSVKLFICGIPRLSHEIDLSIKYQNTDLTKRKSIL